MSIGKIVTVCCDARYEVGLEEIVRRCEGEWGDYFDTVECAEAVIRAEGWTIGKGPDGEAKYVRCPVCAEAKRLTRRKRPGKVNPEDGDGNGTER